MISPERPEYEIKADTTNLFAIGQIITESRYGSVKEDYEIRLKDGDSEGQHPGEGIVHISGRKREVIKGFFTGAEMRYHL